MFLSSGEVTPFTLEMSREGRDGRFALTGELDGTLKVDRRISMRAASRPFQQPGSCRGFTLLEAMVALVIVALGMMAVNTQLNRYAVAAVYVEQKTLASWIASNKLTELSVGSTWPEVGEQRRGRRVRRSEVAVRDQGPGDGGEEPPPRRRVRVAGDGSGARRAQGHGLDRAPRAAGILAAAVVRRRAAGGQRG